MGPGGAGLSIYGSAGFISDKAHEARLACDIGDLTKVMPDEPCRHKDNHAYTTATRPTHPPTAAARSGVRADLTPQCVLPAFVWWDFDMISPISPLLAQPGH